MVCLRSVCLVTLALAGTAVHEAVVHPPAWFQTAVRTAQALTRGVSVEMAVTKNAVSMPAADDSDAWVVTVTEDGKLYFGVHGVTASGLLEAMRENPRNREAKLYVKADARTAFANVRKVLYAGREMGFETPVLLASQKESVPLGTVVPPKGLGVSLGEVPDAVVVQVVGKSQSPAEVKIAGKVVGMADLQKGLGEAAHGRVVELKVDGSVPFGQVMQVIDACSGAGVRVAVESPTV